MIDCKPAETPIVKNHGLQFIEGAEMADQNQYRRLVGKLIYLSHTRPDIAYAVSVVGKFMHQPQVQHIGAVTRHLRYLKETCDRGILFRKNQHLELVAYTEADRASDVGIFYPRRW